VNAIVCGRLSAPLVASTFSPDFLIMKDLTQGSVLSHALTMAVPIFAGLVLVLLCGLIDLYFVAGLGEAAIAGVGAAGNAGFLVSALTQIVSVGTLAVVSQAVGRKDRADANFIFNQSLGLSAVCAVCTLATGLAVARPYMRSVAADAATIEAGTTYLVWFMPALALQFAMLAMSSALRGIGIVRPTMVVQALTVTINVMLAPVLIMGWGTGYALGVKGAGLASSLAVAIGVAALWAYFRKGKNYLSLDRRQWRPQIESWKRILGVGLPAGGEFAIMFAYMAVIYYAIGEFGPAAQAGFSIDSRVLGLVQVPRWPLPSQRRRLSDRISAPEIARASEQRSEAS
jgi:Na+-driven multidrug efflux pump